MTDTLLNNSPHTKTTDSKCDIVRRSLKSSIRKGKFNPGSRLPSEREIAKRLNVSTMTVNRAISQMVASQWLERRPRIGTFVHENAWEKISSKTLNLIGPLYDAPIIRQFYKLGNELARAQGLAAHEVRIGQNLAEVADTILGGSYSLVLALGLRRGNPIAEAMSRVADRAVLIGGRLDDMNVHSVMGDDRHMIRIGMDYLRGYGHTKIGLVCCRRDNYIERERLASWYACHNTDTCEKELQKRLLILDLPQGEHPIDYAYQSLRKAIREDGFNATSLICPDDETAIGLLSACRDEGLKVPEDISIISIGNTSYAQHVTPKLTSLDPNLTSQVELAIELATSNTNDNLAHMRLLHAVEPQLVERESVAKIKHEILS